MASTTQANSNDFGRHQNHLEGSAHLGNNAHGLAVAAAAASYATDNHLAGLVEAATAAAGQDVSWAPNEAGDAVIADHGRALQSHLDGYGTGIHLDNGFGDPGNNGQPDFGGEGSVDDRQMRRSNRSLALTGGTHRKRKRTSNANLDPAMTGESQFGGGLDEAGEGDGHGHGHGHGHTLDIRELSPQQSMSEARAAGVHSAVALFRQPS